MERSKYNIDKDKEKRTHNGIVFDSVMEMRYYRDVVCPKVESGEIIYYELQKTYELQPKFTRNGKTVNAITYVADFFLRFNDGSEEIIDIKGCPDTTANLKRKLFWYVYPDKKYEWITYVKKFGGWLSYEEVKQLRTQAKRQKKLEQKEKEDNEN